MYGVFLLRTPIVADKEKMKKLIWDSQEDIAEYLPPESGVSDRELLQKLITRLRLPSIEASLGAGCEFPSSGEKICRESLLEAIQSRGTGAVSNLFGPITLLWFLAMGAAGIAHIGDDLGILAAVNPVYAVVFLWNGGLVGFIVLGAVFLTVTGAEALYADLGHFGRQPIQAAWFAVVFPALALN